MVLLTKKRMAKLANAPKRLDMKKTLEGENLSAIARNANNKVPTINPNWTEEDIFPNALSGSCKAVCKSNKMAFPANHNEVPANCAKIIIGKMYFGIDDLVIGLDSEW